MIFNNESQIELLVMTYHDLSIFRHCSTSCQGESQYRRRGHTCNAGMSMETRAVTSVTGPIGPCGLHVLHLA